MSIAVAAALVAVAVAAVVVATAVATVAVRRALATTATHQAEQAAGVAAVAAAQAAEADQRNALVVAELRAQAAADREAVVAAAVERLAHLNSVQLGASADLHRAELDARKGAIDTEVDAVRAELARLGDQLAALQQANRHSHGELTTLLRTHAESTASLTRTAQGLREALASTKARGQWGERMAEDVLRLAGFVENVNYRKQVAVEGARSIPDFTFHMPKGHVLYMDVKFPLSAYLRYLDASSDAERDRERDAFLRDVRLRVRELAGRDYLDKGRASAPVDELLLFIPNESICAFIHEHDPALIDDALRAKVVLCSPLTLFALLGVIRQAFDNFMIEQTSDEILRVLGAFTQQWQRFAGALDTLAKRFDSTQKALDDVTGTRRRQLERPLARLEELRQSRGLAVAPDLAPGADVIELGATGGEALGATAGEALGA